ncbi:septum site-determining protein MinC [Candidatus Pantoea carbekii]|uniref:Probable septum site-determining protein MinC n=1 Tax=Candidatus Pantoea carbekii TaxID=1235990 RepID=U3U6K0_9GAMM|nr:septum site-determining protein MinC [Candidatus Pantoea carbekii]AKC32054.1 septum site-determining protein MinC [Candidatus Pantoea carbekii]BAO00580.1 MinC protein [Candidatus Pantoea carbekii]
MSKSPIDFKGSNFTLSVVHLHQSQPEIIRQAIQEKINQAPKFLQNAPIVLNISTLSGDINWLQIQQAVSATGLRIIGVSGCKDETLKKIIASAGLPVLCEGKVVFKTTDSTKSNLVNDHNQETNKARIINTLVRSGQQIYARNTDLIVINNVSAGAELVADGNVHIYGIMRGRVLAGASGDFKCQIFCTNLAAELVSIAGEYWTMDQIPGKFFSTAARLYLQDGVLAIQTLN